MLNLREYRQSMEEATEKLDSKSLAQFADDLNVYGFVLIPDLITRSHAEYAADRLVEIMKRQQDASKADQHLPNILDLLDEPDYPAFAEMIAHPACLKTAEKVLGEGFQLTEPGARWRKPGAPAGPVHAGAPLEKFARWGLPVPNNSFVLAFSWMLNDLKADMGATAYVPFSHCSSRYPGPDSGRQYAIPVEARAGSVVIYHQALWHLFEPNTSGVARVGLMAGYCGSWVDPVQVGYQLMKKSVRDRMPPAVQALNKRTRDD